jgi:hypothetical protein
MLSASLNSENESIKLILAIIIWGAIFYSTGKIMMISSLVVISLGLIAYFVSRKMKWIGGDVETTPENTEGTI